MYMHIIYAASNNTIKFLTQFCKLTIVNSVKSLNTSSKALTLGCYPKLGSESKSIRCAKYNVTLILYKKNLMVKYHEMICMRCMY